MIPLDSGTVGRANDEYGMFASFVPDVPEGAHFSAKDNLTAVGMETRAGSRILEGYRPAFDAAAVERMRSAGAFLAGKTNMDEFGFGTFSVNSGFGIPRNPHDRTRSCGGSSGGSACAAAVFRDHVSLGVSTGGSISCPAAFCGVFGLTPTYGRVSRYGLIDYGNSLDKVGLLSYSASGLRRYLPVISGRDPRDPTSCVQPDLGSGPATIRRVAVPTGSLDGVSAGVRRSFEEALDLLRSMGVETGSAEMPSLRYAMPAYYVLATSEASTNLARYCGMRYGRQGGDLSMGFDDYFSSFRSEYFGKEAKRRILLGTFARMAGFRDRYYTKALQVRGSVIGDYKRVFEDFDAVLTPTMPFVAPRFDEISGMGPLESYKADVLTIPPNISGMPHLSVPCGYPDGMPAGMQFVTDHWNEGALMTMAEEWDSAFGKREAEVRL